VIESSPGSDLPEPGLDYLFVPHWKTFFLWCYTGKEGEKKQSLATFE